MDISREENKAIYSQLAMNNISLNQDVLDVIKSFAFYDKNEFVQKKLQKQRKDDVMKIIQESMGYSVHEYLDEGIGHWAIWLPWPQNEDDDDLQLQASTCLKCGKYTHVGTLDLENAIINNKYIVCVNGEH